MNPDAPSPALVELRAVGRALKGTARVLLRWQMWLLLVALALVIPWHLGAWLDWLSVWLDSARSTVVVVAIAAGRCAVDATCLVLLLALLLPLLDGARALSLQGLRPAAGRLTATAALFAGLIGVDWLVSGWVTADPLGFLLGGLQVSPTTEIPLCLAEAFLFARVLADLRGSEAWLFGARHLVVAGLLLFAGDIAIGGVPVLVERWTASGEWTVGGPLRYGSIPWAAWELGRNLVGVAAFEYLRGVRAPAGESPA